MGRRSDHSRDEIREMALAAAEQVVAEQGLAGLSARKVAGAIGYTVGTLYLVFDNLDELILHVNVRTLDELHAVMVKALRRCRGPESCVLALGRAYVRYADTHRHRWSLLFEHRLPEGQEVPEWFRAKVAAMFELVEGALAPMSDHRSGREIGLAARALWSGVHGVAILALTDKLGTASVESVQALTDSLIRNYLAGFAGAGGR